MSLTDTKLQRIYEPILKRDRRWEGDGAHSYLDCPTAGVLFQNSNLAVAGFPTSLQPYDIAYFPSEFEVKIPNSMSNMEDVNSQITTVMHERCLRGAQVTKDDLRPHSVIDERCVDAFCTDSVPARLAKDGGRIRRIPLEFNLVPRTRATQKESGSSSSSSSSKQLKFGIEAILDIGNKGSEKTTTTTSDHQKQRLVGRWNGETQGSVEDSRDIYGYRAGRPPTGKPPLTCLSPRSPWCHASSHPLGGSRWDGPLGSVDVGKIRWTSKEQCQDYHEGFPSQHSPYPWRRTSDPAIQHCFPLQPTLPPSHPTLPRSYHHSASVSSTRLVQDNGLDVKSNLGGSGGIAGTITNGHKRKRSWSRAVFTSLQRKGLEKRFEIQKYVNKPERRQLASALGLSDAQVKVWFQNRRMKWRHTQQFKRTQQEQHEQHEQQEQLQDQQIEQGQHVNSEGEDNNNNDIGKEDTCNMRKKASEFGTPAFFVGNHGDGRDDDIATQTRSERH